MEKYEQVKQWALEQVGCPYVYGGTGQPCTPEYRAARAAQYPQYAVKINRNCDRNVMQASSCLACEYYDKAKGQGKPCYDCAQLTRWAMNEIGIIFPSGATSQWNNAAWSARGSIDTLDAGILCILYRKDSENVFGHTGIYLGDGTVVHAKGHDYGVVREKLSACEFTHWAIPSGLYEQIPVEEKQMEITGHYLVTGNALALRTGPGTEYNVIARITKNTVLDAYAKLDNGWAYVKYGDKIGYAMLRYLKASGTDPEKYVNIQFPESVAKEIYNALCKIYTK